MKRLIRLLLACLILTFTESALQAHSYSLNHIGESKGLKGISIFKFHKDRTGLMWMGTNIGICSFDGRNVTNYEIDCMPPQSIVTDVAESPEGHIIFCCANGLYKVDKKTGSCVRIHPDIQDPTCLCRIGDELFIGSGHGLWSCKKDGTSELILLEKNNISKSNIVNHIVYDGDGKIWISTNSNICSLDMNSRKITKYSLPPEIRADHLQQIVRLGHKLYIGTMNYGIISFDTKTKEYAKYDAGIRCNVISDITTDGEKLLYVATDGHGAFIVDTQQDRIIRRFGLDTPDFPLSSNSIYTFWKDSQSGIYWFGFFEDGFCYNFHTEPTFHIYMFKDIDTKGMHVRSFAIHKDEKLIGTRNGLYFISERRNLTRYYPPETTGSGIITDVIRFGGKYVVSTYGNGLYILDPQTLEISNARFTEELRHGRCGRLLLSPEEDYLFALSDLGIYTFDKEFQLVDAFTNKNSELPDSYFTDMIFDQEQKGWIASLERLSIYDPTNHTIQSHGFAEDFFNEKGELGFSLCRNGDILAYSRDNVYRTKSDLSSFSTIDLYQRFGLKQLFFFIETADHHFWVGTDKGLFLFDKDFKHFRHLNESDNLPSLRFNKQEYQWTGHDTLWMANQRGLVYITKKEYQKIPDKTFEHVMLNDLRLGQDDADLQDTEDVNRTKTIRLTWNPLEFPDIGDGNFFRFKLMQLDYKPLSGRFYEWAFDRSGFIPAYEDEPVEIKKVSLGTHTLKVRVAGYPKTEEAYTVTCRLSLLFYAECVILLFFISSAVYLLWVRNKQHRLKELLRQKHELELHIIQEKTAKRVQTEEQDRQKTEKAQSMYQKVKLSDEEYALLYKKVKTYMEEKRPYINSELRLSDLAQAIGHPTAHLSQMFNAYTKQNFFDFVNRYRIEKFKRDIKDPAYGKFTITAICEQCGFKRSTFFSVFKRFENCTPTEYMEQHDIRRK